MPIYEYQCEDCGRKSSFLILKLDAPFSKVCSHYGSTSLRRVMSRFASVRSEEDRLESLADPSKWGDIDESDPKSVAKFVKKMGKEMGEDLGEDIDQLADEAAREAETGFAGSQETGDDAAIDSADSLD